MDRPRILYADTIPVGINVMPNRFDVPLQGDLLRNYMFHRFGVNKNAKKIPDTPKHGNYPCVLKPVPGGCKSTLASYKQPTACAMCGRLACESLSFYHHHKPKTKITIANAAEHASKAHGIAFGALTVTWDRRSQNQ